MFAAQARKHEHETAPEDTKERGMLLKIPSKQNSYSGY
jgi:hypothetical protein